MWLRVRVCGSENVVCPSGACVVPLVIDLGGGG